MAKKGGALDRTSMYLLKRLAPTLVGDLGTARVDAALAHKFLDALKSRMDVGDQLRVDFHEARSTDEYRAVYSDPDPLVTCVIATYNRPRLLAERAIPSLLAQTHRNLQIVVVGDRASAETARAVAGVRDSRVEYVQLVERGEYPEHAQHRWMVAGGPAMNEGLRRAEGGFITHLDDDDRHEAHRVSVLLADARSHHADVLWHPYRREETGWKIAGGPNFRPGEATTSSLFYHRWLARIEWDPLSYLLEEPGDWNRIRKFNWLGVNAVYHPEPLLWHYRELTQLTKD